MPDTTPITDPLHAVTTGQTAAAPVAGEARHMQRRLMQAVCEHDQLDAVLDAVTDTLGRAFQPAAVFYFRRDEAQRLQLARSWQHGRSANEPAELQQPVAAACGKSCAAGQTEADHTSIPGMVVVSVPVFVRGRPPEAYCVVVAGTRSLDRNAALLQLAATHVSLWYFLHAEQRAPFAADLLELIQRLMQAPDVRDAAQTLSGEICRIVGAERVAVAICRGGPGQVSVEALSGLRRFDRRSELVRLVEATCRDATVQGTLAVWPASSPPDGPATPTHERLAAAAGAECVVSLPLRDAAGQVKGACVLWGPVSRLSSGKTVEFLREAEPRLATCLGLVVRARSGLLTTVRRSVRESIAGRKQRLAVGAALVLALLLAVPVPHRIACRCQIQPVTRRYVAAPHDGMLERALVASGDVVSQGQTLARMDGREVRCELATLYADRAAATKKRDAAMAAHDAAEMQMARLDIERLDLQINVLERRVEHLEIKAAIGGIVILGDLERAEGAPLTVGQNLFEIAPLDKMVVELAVPEDDIAYVGPHSQVRFRLDAYPGRRWEGAVEKIHPRAEQQEDQQVFVAEFDLDNGDQRLKPGMSGRARITSRLRPLFWVLFHKAWERAVMKLGW